MKSTLNGQNVRLRELFDKFEEHEEPNIVLDSEEVAILNSFQGKALEPVKRIAACESFKSEFKNVLPI